MPEPLGRIYVAAGGDVIYGRIQGLGNRQNCYALRDYVREARTRGFRRVLMDLHDCDGLDSTFIGVIIEIVVGDGEGAGLSVLLANANARVRRSLEDVGVHRVVSMPDEAFPDPGLRLRCLPNPPVSPRDQARLVLGAHRRLLELDPTNEEKFGALVDLLARELGETETGGEGR